MESDVITDYKNKLKVDNFPMPNSFKIPHEKKMKEWHFGQCYHVKIYLIFLTFYPSELINKDFSDYKNSKAYSYYRSSSTFAIP